MCDHTISSKSYQSVTKFYSLSREIIALTWTSEFPYTFVLGNDVTILPMGNKITFLSDGQEWLIQEAQRRYLKESWSKNLHLRKLKRNWKEFFSTLIKIFPPQKYKIYRYKSKFCRYTNIRINLFETQEKTFFSVLHAWYIVCACSRVIIY